jgi:hypothetical protein
MELVEDTSFDAKPYRTCEVEVKNAIKQATPGTWVVLRCSKPLPPASAIVWTVGPVVRLGVSILIS